MQGIFFIASDNLNPFSFCCMFELLNFFIVLLGVLRFIIGLEGNHQSDSL